MPTAVSLRRNPSWADRVGDLPGVPDELHTTSMPDGKMVMTPGEGGFVVKAGATHERAPGADLRTLVEPSAAIEPGGGLSFLFAPAG